ERSSSSKPPPTILEAVEETLGAFGSPRSRRVALEAPFTVLGPAPQHGIEEPPRPFDLVAAREKRRVSGDRVEKQTLVCVGRGHPERMTVADVHLHLSDPDVGPGDLRAEAERDPLVRLDVENERVRSAAALGGREETERRRTKADRDLGQALRQAFSVTKEERDSGPTPVVDVEFERRVGRGRRALRHALLLAIAGKELAEPRARSVLPAHRAGAHGFAIERPERLEDLHLLVSDRVGLDRGGRLHCDEREK